ncbi:hypothetical protein PAV_3c06580 [Paenibacillus alvei DSM 29]|nr:hypothetical protein PAV_3c06580 [Paenibacillus alvei DSM 29]
MRSCRTNWKTFSVLGLSFCPSLIGKQLCRDGRLSIFRTFYLKESSVTCLYTIGAFFTPLESHGILFVIHSLL